MTTETRERYWCKRDMKYDVFHFERGEIVELRGHPNDAALIRVDYVTPLKVDYPNGCEEASCVSCGKVFVDQSFKAMHDKNHHIDEPEIDLSQGPDATAIGGAVEGLAQSIGEKTGD